MTGWALPALANVQLGVGLFPLNPRGYPSAPARSGPSLARDGQAESHLPYARARNDYRTDCVWQEHGG
jgi:hypothetical protein